MSGRVLVTGANGFVGARLCELLLEAEFEVVGAVRSLRVDLQPPLPCVKPELVEVGNISADTRWAKALAKVETVIHLAARVHVMRERRNDAFEEYRRVNTFATQHLAAEAAKSGVRRLIFVSSVKVNGEGRDDRYSARDIPMPVDSYGISKWQAEQLLRDVEAKSDLEVVIVRAPLVYGPGVRGNFQRLIRLAQLAARVPLPLGGIENRRSIVYRDNLADALICCIDTRADLNAPFFVSDARDVSTTELLLRISTILKIRPRLFWAPAQLVVSAAFLAGKTGEARRLLESLTVDSQTFCTVTGWEPKVSLDEALARTIEYYG